MILAQFKTMSRNDFKNLNKGVYDYIGLYFTNTIVKTIQGATNVFGTTLELQNIYYKLHSGLHNTCTNTPLSGLAQNLHRKYRMFANVNYVPYMTSLHT